MDLEKQLHESNSVFIAPLGGLGEIGMNMMVLVHKGEAVVIDCGAMFPEMNQLGLDIVVPKVDFIREYRLKLKSIVFTHGHEDHIGAIPFLFSQLKRPKIFATGFTLGMLEQRLKDTGNYDRDNIEEITPGVKFRSGPFGFEALRVTHSLVDCTGLIIRTPVGTIVHSGDFKIDREPLDDIHIDEDKFKQIGDEGVALLMTDSTNIDGEGWTVSEKEVVESLEKIISEIKTGRIVVTLFSSNIIRLQALFKIAHKVGRKVVLAGRSISSNTELAKRLGFLKLDKNLIVNSRQADELPPEKTLILATGTQAEPRSSLAKMSLRLHSDLSIGKGDTVIFSSRHIPGNEKKISNLMNNIYRCGATTIDFRDALVHTSGHAKQDELKLLQEWVRPKFFLPVHGEYRMLVKHFETMKEFNPKIQGFVAENGDLLELTKDSFTKRTKVDFGKLFLDEERNFLSEKIIRDRKKMAYNGVAIVNVVVSERKLQIIEGPDIRTIGLPEDVDWVSLEDQIEHAIEEYIDGDELDIEGFEEEIRLLTRRLFRKATGIKPRVFPKVYLVA